MPEMMVAVYFALLVFLPCGAATAGLRLRRFAFGDLDGFGFAPPRALGKKALPVCALGAERAVTEEFQIRSFAKGLKAKRSKLIRDGGPTFASVMAEAGVILPAAVPAVPVVRSQAPVVPVAAAVVQVSVPAVSVRAPINPAFAESSSAAPVIAQQAEVLPRTKRRRMMLQMVDDRSEAQVWLARASAARAELDSLHEAAGAGWDTADRAQLVAEEAREAAVLAADALRRVARLEALLQGRADAEMPSLVVKREFGGTRKSTRAA